MSSPYVDADAAKGMPPSLVAPVVSWLASSDCPLNGETLLAGAGKIARAVRIEGLGIGFDPPESISPDGISAGLESLMSLTDWVMPPNGIAAFDGFRQSAPLEMIRPATLP